MNKYFYDYFNTIQHEKDALLKNVSNFPPEKLNYSARPGKWSVAQILTHLVTSEKLTVGYMKKKVQAADQLKNSGLSESLRLWVLILSQRVPLKYKAPKVILANTPEAPSLEELIRQWDDVRTQLAEFLGSIDSKDVRKVIFKHPLAGRFDARQALIFMREHIRHHKPQIDRILKLPHT
jgi:hypothetical protein